MSSRHRRHRTVGVAFALALTATSSSLALPAFAAPEPAPVDTLSQPVAAQTTASASASSCCLQFLCEVFDEAFWRALHDGLLAAIAAGFAPYTGAPSPSPTTPPSPTPAPTSSPEPTRSPSPTTTNSPPPSPTVTAPEINAVEVKPRTVVSAKSAQLPTISSPYEPPYPLHPGSAIALPLIADRLDNIDALPASEELGTQTVPVGKTATITSLSGDVTTVELSLHPLDQLDNTTGAYKPDGKPDYYLAPLKGLADGTYVLSTQLTTDDADPAERTTGTYTTTFAVKAGSEWGGNFGVSQEARRVYTVTAERATGDGERSVISVDDDLRPPLSVMKVHDPAEEVADLVRARGYLVEYERYSPGVVTIVRRDDFLSTDYVMNVVVEEAGAAGLSVVPRTDTEHVPYPVSASGGVGNGRLQAFPAAQRTQYEYLVQTTMVDAEPGEQVRLQLPPRTFVNQVAVRVGGSAVASYQVTTEDGELLLTVPPQTALDAFGAGSVQNIELVLSNDDDHLAKLRVSLQR